MVPSVAPSGPGDQGPRPLCVVIVQRQLEDYSSGNASYLAIFLKAAKAAGYAIHIVFAPERSFSNRPWAGLNPRFEALADSVTWPRSLRIGQRFVSLSWRVYRRFAVRLVQEALRRAGSTSRFAQVQSFLGSPLDPTEMRNVLKAMPPDTARLVVAEYSSLAPVLAEIPPGPAKAALLHDLFALRAESMRAIGRAPDHVDITMEEEARRCAGADALFYASDTERAAFAAHLPGAQHIWMRPDVGRHTPTTPQGEARAVFLGTRHAGNFDALAVLMEEIWPRVLDRRPGSVLWIAGSIGDGLPSAWAALPGVKTLGRVADLATIGGRQSVGLAPTRAASGVSIKVAEYMRLAMPVVAMPMALEGFGDSLDDLAEIADTPTNFADRVVALLNDDAARAHRADRGFREIGARLSNAALERYLTKTRDPQPRLATVNR
ncbi:MAG: glycosyltransferase family 4 protein [Pseudomonadota bacterium]